MINLKVVVSSDKDSRGTECLVYNPFGGDGIQDCSGFGGLYLNSKVLKVTVDSGSTSS